MIKVSDIDWAAHGEISFDDVVERMALEREFDAAIQKAVDANKWPATVEHSRDCIRSSNVMATLDLYRVKGGWVVTSDQRYRAIFERAKR